MFRLSAISILIGTVSIPLSTSVFADQTDTSATSVEHISVTATRTERHFMESPAAVASINAQDIQRSSADSVADVLKDIPGIQVTDAATPGMKRITLRGESSLRVAILIDGQEVTDHSTYGAPLLLDTSMVERVEVIRGTSSVLYGGKALGGVINIVTKKGGNEPVEVALSSGYHAATQGQQYSAAIYGHAGGLDYRLAVSNNEHKDRNTPAGDIDDTSFSNDSMMLYVAKELDEHLFGINYELYKLSSEIATGIPGFFLDMPQRDRKKASLFYTYDPDGDVFKQWHIDAYDQSIDRNFVQHMEMTVPLQPPITMDMVIDTNIQERLETTGLNSQFDFALNDNHYAIVGFQLGEDDLNKATDNTTTSTTNIPNVPAVPKVSQSHSTEIASLQSKALYLQDEWRLSEKLILTAGARQYWVDAELHQSSRDGLNPLDNKDTHFIGSFAANYSLDKQRNIRAVFSQGYHYPTLLQIATGATAAGTYRNPNPQLKPETSDNVELGFRLFTKRWMLDSTLFYTDADHYITTRSCAGSGLDCVNPTRDTIYVNADTAKTKGLELSVDYKATEQISPYANVTWLSREESYGSFTTRDTGTPSVYGKLGVKYEGSGNLFSDYYLDAFVRGASGADESYADGTTDVYDGWHTFNIGFGSTLGENDSYAFNVELSNIFDKQYSPANETLIAPGRALVLKLSANF